MNQIRSDRDTKTHMLVQPVCFIISLLLFCSLFFSRLRIFLSSCLTQVAQNYLPPQVGFLADLGVREEHSCTLVRSQVWLASFTGMNGPTNAAPSRPPLFLSHLLCLFNSHSTTVVLLGCGTRRAATEEVPQ